MAYAGWNLTPEEARQSRRDADTDTVTKGGIAVKFDNSNIGHPSWELWEINMPDTAKCTIEGIVCNGKALSSRNLHARFQLALDESRPIQMTMGLFSGFKFDTGYIDYRCEDRGVTNHHRRSFKIGDIVDFSFRLQRVTYFGNSDHFIDANVRPFELFYGCRDRNKGEKFVVSNESMGGDVEGGVVKTAYFYGIKRYSPKSMDFFLWFGKEGTGISLPVRNLSHAREPITHLEPKEI